MPTELKLTPGTLASNCYPSDPQQFYNDMFSLGVALAGDLNGVVVSDAAPAAEDRDKMWVKTSGGAPVRHFIWYNGAWVWPHDVSAGSQERKMWVGAEASLVTYDGGDAGAIGDASGAMWEVDHDFDARLPIGPGTLPLSTTVIAVGDTGGVDQVTLTEGQMPEHSHFGPTIHHTAALDWTYVDTYGTTAVAGTNKAIDPTSDSFSGRVRPATQPTGSGEAHQNMPPYRGIFIIKRTARVYYKG